MIAPDQSFGKLLEQYALEVADLFIESADQQTQSALIQLISGIDTTPNPGEHDAGLLPGEEREREWQQVLNTPVDWVSVDIHRLMGQIRHRMQRNELYMAHLRQAIGTIEQRYQRTQSRIISEPQRSELLDQHRRTQTCFQLQLEMAQ